MREHRLIHRTSTVKYNSRTAEANAVVQDEERKQSLLREVGNASITADANQKASLSQQAKIIGATTPQEQAVLDQARQRLGEAQSVYTNQSNGSNSVYNTETGKVTAMGAVEQSRRERLSGQPMGEIDQSKYARLDKANATPEQRKTNEANLQGIMNYTDTSTLEPITNAGVVETPQQFEERKAFIEKQNTEKATQDEIKRKKQEDIAAAGAASTAAGSKALERSKENPAPINDTAKMDRVSTMIDGIIGASGDPMGPVYKEMMMQDFQDMEDAKANAALSRDASFARAEEQDNDVQTLIDKYTKIHRENNEAYTKLLDETRDSQQKYLAEQEQRDKAKLAWDADMETQKLTKQKTQQLLSQSIQNALGGGAFSGAANEQLAATEREWDTAISNLAAEFSFKEADVSAFYTQKYVDTNNQFNMDVFNAAKALDEKIEGYALQGFNSIQARKTAETAAQNQYRTDITNAKTTYSTAIKGYIKEMQTILKDEKQAAIDKEDRALNQISSLLNNFPEAEVKDIIMGLGKDVKSFSVEAMLNAKSNTEIEAARKAAAARAQYAAQQYAQKSANAPAITADEFVKQKIAEKETQLGMSMNEKMRKEYIAANNDYFQTQYDQLVSPKFQNITSGIPAVDAATDAFVRGDFSTIKDAAKTFNVDPSLVATHAGRLRTEGAKVGDIRALQPEQAKELTTLRKSIDDNDVTKKLNVMDTAIPKIGVARASLTGVGDVALLNFYQNGIVDPGLAVRAEDANLLRKASALKDKITTQFAEDVLLKGAFFPDETRAEMEKIAKGVLEATERVYQEKVFTPTIEQAQLSGIGEAYFNYKARKPSQTEGSNADTYISTFGR